jgi:hypothetical protein
MQRACQREHMFFGLGEWSSVPSEFFGDMS